MPDDDVVPIREAALPLAPAAFTAPLIDLIGSADVVVIGAASHGTHEFCRLRADLTAALIEQRGFTMVAIDADWDETFRANRYVRLAADDLSAADAVGALTAFPRWAWRNHDVVHFLEWLREHNTTRPPHARVGFYGLDALGMYSALDQLFLFLRRREPRAIEAARRRYATFDIFGEPPEGGLTPTLGLSSAAANDALAQLVELRRRVMPHHDETQSGADHSLALEQNTRALATAETYYRELLAASTTAWNVRDQHLLLTLEALVGHAVRMAGAARVVVWAHNVHAGDARATHLGRRGMVSFGQRARERFGSRVCTIGFTTHGGVIAAAPVWNGGTDQIALRPSLRDSYERLFHDTGRPFFAIDLRRPQAAALRPARLERAVGAVYYPESERWRHYFDASLVDQFDIVIHCDETLAVVPLDKWSHRDLDLPETWPAEV
jgi:erythromycin esterase-like protein